MITGLVGRTTAGCLGATTAGAIAVEVCDCTGGCCGLAGTGLFTPAAMLANDAGGRLMLASIGLVGLFLALHSNQLATSGSLRSPCPGYHENMGIISSRTKR